MSTQIENFADSASKFIKNPLGIIGLFIVLLYGFASLVLGFSNNLNTEQKWPLIWFLVIFPILILASFLWLVIKHHTKLYSPRDYRTDDSFLQTATLEEQKEKKYEEFIEQENGGVQLSSKIPSISPEITEYQDKQKMVKESINKAFLAEELVLRELESEYGKPFLRNMKIKSKYSSMIFDGFNVSKDEIIAVEVKYFRKGLSIQVLEKTIYNMNRIFENVKKDIHNKTFLILLVIVSEEDMNLNDDRLKIIFDRIKNLPFKIEMKFFNLNKLQNKFGM